MIMIHCMSDVESFREKYQKLRNKFQPGQIDLILGKLDSLVHFEETISEEERVWNKKIYDLLGEIHICFQQKLLGANLFLAIGEISAMIEEKEGNNE